MKKRILILIACLVVAATMCLSVSLPPKPDAQPSTPTCPPGSSCPTVSTTTTTTPPPAPPEVTLYSCDPSLAEAYRAMAARYTDETGIQVTFVSVAAGSCAEALQLEKEQGRMPTIFCLHSAEDLQLWQDQLLDLSGSAIAGALYSDSFALKSEDRILGVAADVEGFGILYNAYLLGSKAGYTRQDFTDFAYFSDVVSYITDYRRELGFSPFGTSSFDSTDHSGLACLLAGMQEDPQQLRAFWDLYIRNCRGSTTALETFLAGESVFYIGGTWDYDLVAGLQQHNLDILPLFSPEGGSLRCVCQSYWCVNAEAAPQDIQAALDFLEWMVSAGDGSAAPVDSLGLLSPYTDAAAWGNPLEKKLRSYIRTEPVIVSWEVCPGLTQQQLVALTEALSSYSKSPSDALWEAVEAVLAGQLPEDAPPPDPEPQA